MKREIILKNAKGQGPLEQAEEALYPGIPYALFTREMRFATYDWAKQHIFEKTGRLIPPA